MHIKLRNRYNNTNNYKIRENKPSKCGFVMRSVKKLICQKCDGNRCEHYHHRRHTRLAIVKEYCREYLVLLTLDRLERILTSL